MNEKKEKILVVEPNEAHRTKATEILRYANYGVLEALAPDDALHLATNEKPHVVLVGLARDDTKGFDIIQALKSHETTTNTPIIGLHETNDAETRKKAEEIGCTGFLEKPFTPYVAEQEFKRVLGRTR